MPIMYYFDLFLGISSVVISLLTFFYSDLEPLLIFLVVIMFIRVGYSELIKKLNNSN